MNKSRIVEIVESNLESRNGILILKAISDFRLNSLLLVVLQRIVDT